MPSAAETAQAEQQRQMHAIIRRMEVCDRLRMVALQSGNELLMRQADDLEARAQEIYRLKTANLPLAAEPLATLAGDAERKPVKRDQQRTAESGRTSKDLNGGQILSKRPLSLYDSPERLGGSMEQREQAALDGTGMGRDRP